MLQTLSKEAVQFIDFAHTPMCFGYGSHDEYFKSKVRTITIGHNPAPSKSDHNKLVHGTKTLDLTQKLIKSFSNNGHISRKCTHALKTVGAKYFSHIVHPYFTCISPTLAQFHVCHIPGSQTSTALHLDILKWATTCGWGDISVPAKREVFRQTVILEDLRRFQPQIVIIGLAFTVVEEVFPDLLFEVLTRFEKPKVTIVVRYSWKKLSGMPTTLWIQTEGNPFPLTQVSLEERKKVGKLIELELQKKGVAY